MIRNNIFLDNNATTPLLPEVKAKIAESLDIYANSATLYEIGQQANALVENARKTIADYVGCSPTEIIFTSGGSESDNMAIISTYDFLQSKGNHIITAKTEHKAVLNTCRYLEDYRGADVTYLDVDSSGFINLNELRSAITDKTILISIMHVNNEIGTIQPISSISAIARERGILFHTDNVQGFCHMNLDISEADLMSVSGHKFGAPKGIGFLYVKDGIELPAFIHGGHQESGKRAGTTNVVGILAMEAAIKQWKLHGEAWNKQCAELSRILRSQIFAEIPDAKLNGPDFPRACNNTNFSFAGIRGEELAALLDMNHIYVSTGSACNSADHSPSHVLKAIGLSDDEAESSIRISVSHENTEGEINYAIDKMKTFINELRSR